MSKLKSIQGVGLSILSGMILTVPAFAADPTQSDITGTNIWNSTAPIFGTQRNIDPEILNTARRLSTDLEEAYTACAASAEAVADVPRRFARGAKPEEICDSVECQRLSQLIQETNKFLSGLDSVQAERLRASGAFQVW